MSDLISRSELLKAFNNKNIKITFDLPVEEVIGEDVDLDDFAILVEDAIQEYRKMVVGTIENHPTAYYINKVVEKLEGCLESERNYINIIYSEKNPVTARTLGRIEAFKKAIEIVKLGYVADDVCEWKLDTTFKGMYKTCSGDLTYIKGFKYCPYCRKKIKVVND